MPVLKGSPISLLKGLSVLISEDEFFYAGSGGNSPEMATGFGKLYKKLMPRGLHEQLKQLKQVIVDPDLLQFTKPKPTHGTGHVQKMIMYNQFLTWANLKNPALIKSDEVVLGQLSVIVDRFNVKDIPEWYNHSTNKFTLEFTRILQKYMMRVCQRNPDLAEDLSHYLLTVEVPTYIKARSVAEHGCRDSSVSSVYEESHPLPGVACAANTKLFWDNVIDPNPVMEETLGEESLPDYSTLSILTNGMVWPMIEHSLLKSSSTINFIRVHGISVNYSEHCWHSASSDKAPRIISLPFHSLKPINWYSHKIMELFTYLMDEQEFLYKKWQKGCFEFNSKGLPQIEYDPRSHLFNVKSAQQSVLTQQNNHSVAEIHRSEKHGLFKNATDNIG